MVALFLLQYAAYGQGGYRITAGYGGGYRFRTSEVWSISLFYSGSKSVNAILQATITGSNGRKWIEMSSESIQLQPGTNALSAASTGTRLQQYFLPGLAEFEQTNGSLPAGIYTICYQAGCASQDCDGAGQGALYNEFPECVQLTVEPPTPLLLAWPGDGSEIESRRPAFGWIPPMPLAQVQGFSYTYSLYVAQKGQTCNEAALSNPPLYRSSGLEQPSLAYPPEMDDLDTGKNYCWKVDGMLSDAQVAQSEVWRFRIGTFHEQKRKLSIIHLNSVASLVPYNVKLTDTLVLLCTEVYQFSRDANWTIEIREEGIPESQNLRKILLGRKLSGSANLYTIPSESAKIEKNRQYILTVYNEKLESFKARIVFQ
ncbi:MAG: hypothetical protein JNL57_12030 [Bacteroidetes bacterium]|nr:hypothetical protein [Bacteroidota bacterium]